MKKIIIAIILISVIVGASVWGLNYQQNNTIKKVKLTEKDEKILSINQNRTLMFDYKADKEYKEFKFWVEKYEAGVLVDNHVVKSSMEKGETDDKHLNEKMQGTITFNVLELTADSNIGREQTEVIFNLVNNMAPKEKSITWNSMQGIDILSEDSTEIWSNMVSDFEQKTMKIDGEMLLASVMYIKGDNDLIMYPNGFYSVPKITEEHLKNYDVAYLLKAEFKK